jgi:uncharacterized membrane protein
MRVLPTPLGAMSVTLASLNDRGQFVGDAFTNGASGLVFFHHAALWAPDGSVTDLVPPSGWAFSSSRDVNNQGDVAGILYNDTQLTGAHAFVWSVGAGYDVFEPPPGGETILPTALNDSGVVVGLSFQEDPQFERHGFIRRPKGLAQQLPDPPGKSTVYAQDINNHGVVLVQTDRDVYLWSAARGFVPLGDPHFADNTFAIKLNDAGFVAGYSNRNSYAYSWRWSPIHGFWPIGGLPGAVGGASSVSGMNNLGQLVGQSGGHPFLWTPSFGMQELPAPSDAFLGTFAQSISSDGHIVGFAVFGGVYRGIVWTLSGTPATRAREISTQVATLAASGRLTQLQETGLQNELAITARLLERGLHVSPAGVLEGFIRHVEGIERNSGLSSADGATLTDPARCLIAVISGAQP